MNPTTYIDVTCCGQTVRRLRLVVADGSAEWFLAPDGSYEGFTGDRQVMLGAEAADRGRYEFTCPSCGRYVPARAERLRIVAEKLRVRGVPSVELSALRGILRKS